MNEDGSGWLTSRWGRLPTGPKMLLILSFGLLPLGIVALFASVETMLQRSSLFWTRHCDTGRFETLETAKGSGVGALRDFPGVSPLHCTLLTGWIEGMGEAAGASEATTEKVKCVHRGDPWCEYHGRWT